MLQNIKKKVQVWVYHQNPETKVLAFLLLKTDAKRGGFWQPVTGNVDEGESLEAAALREAREETGLDFEGEPVLVAEPFKFQSRHGYSVEEHGYALKVASHDQKPPQVKLDPNEHTEFGWVTAKGAFHLTTFPSNKQVLKTLLQKLIA